jgi:cytochrome c oxidase subunit I
MAIGRKTQGKTTQGTPRSKGLLKRPTAKGLVGWLTTVDHKRLGIMYLVTSFGFFVAGSLEAALMRLQLAFPEQNIIPVDMYNELFTVHGVNMILFAIMPMGVGFANYFVPLMIGARDLAFPRLNALGYWAYLAGGIIFYSSFILGHAPHVGWFAYAPLTQLEFTPGAGTDFYTVGLLISGIGTLITAMNFIVTIINMRAPGMTMLRVPLFPWMILITSFIIIFAFPVITIALAQILLDRTVGTVFYDTTAGALFYGSTSSGFSDTQKFTS